MYFFMYRLFIHIFIYLLMYIIYFIFTISLINYKKILVNSIQKFILFYNRSNYVKI